jgi:hypothetical protein
MNKVKMDTIGDCLKVMEGDVLADDGGGLGQLTIAELEDARWKALAILMRDLLQGEGYDMSWPVSRESEPQKPDGKKRGISWWGGYKE